MLPHSSTRWQTLWGGTASLHCGQMFNAGATRKSWLRRFPLADIDFRLLGTATTDSPGYRAIDGRWKRYPLSESFPPTQGQPDGHTREFATPPVAVGVSGAVSWTRFAG